MNTEALMISGCTGCQEIICHDLHSAILHLRIGENLLKKSTAKLTLTGSLKVSNIFIIASYSAHREDKLSPRNHGSKMTPSFRNDVESL